MCFKLNNCFAASLLQIFTDVPVSTPDGLPAGSSLQGLVKWYQDHSQCCLEEPRLQALEPRPDCSMAALWQCNSGHSFVQYLSSSPGRLSHSDEEREGDGGNGTLAHLHTATCGVVSSSSGKIRSDTHQHSRGADGLLSFVLICD